MLSKVSAGTAFAIRRKTGPSSIHSFTLSTSTQRRISPMPWRHLPGRDARPTCCLMEFAPWSTQTRQFGIGGDAIPERHGEFFIPSLSESLELYQPLTPPETWSVWRERLKNKRQNVIRGNLNNWETYAMKGEWIRQDM